MPGTSTAGMVGNDQPLVTVGTRFERSSKILYPYMFHLLEQVQRLYVSGRANVVVGHTQGKADGRLACSDGGDGDGHDHARHVIQVRGSEEEVQVAADMQVNKQHTRLMAYAWLTLRQAGRQAGRTLLHES